MAITINGTDTAYQSSTSGGTTDTTGSHTVLASGSNRVGVVFVSWNNNNPVSPVPAVSSVTWDGNSMTFEGSQPVDDDGISEIWFIEGASVTSGVIVVTWNHTRENAPKMIVVTDFTDAGTPTGFLGTAYPGGPGSTGANVLATPTITSTSGDIIVACGGGETGNCTVGTTNSPTEIMQWDEINDGELYSVATQYQVTSGNEIAYMGRSVDDHSHICGCNIPESIGATTISPPADTLTVSPQAPTLTARALEQRAFRFRNDDGSKGPRF